MAPVTLLKIGNASFGRFMEESGLAQGTSEHVLVLRRGAVNQRFGPW